MPTTSIKISQLDPIASLTGSDFFPIDQSSSIKTYRASLTQLQNLFSTGSFTGSLTGTVTGTGTSPQFVGTSSWAISSSRAISSSYSDFSNSSSYALSASRSETASYALNSNAGDLSGAGTTNYLPKWTGNKTLGDSTIYYGTPIVGYPGNVSTSDFYIQKNTPFIYITGSGQGSLSIVSSYNSTLALGSATTSSDAHSLIVGADGGMPSTDSRGVFDWTSFSGSNNLASRQSNDPGSGIVRLLRIKSNGWYFWPLYGVQSISRDGTVNIGIDSNTENHDTRLKIFVFSGSSVSNPVVSHLGKAIEVTYGSGSSNPITFCVSSSGQVTAAGYSGSNFNAVSFYGTASYAMNTPTNNSNVRVPVFVTTSSNAILSGTTNFNLILSLSLPSGYTTWDEFSIRANLCVTNTGTGNITGSLCYGDGTLFSLTSGSGNSEQQYALRNSDDTITPIWEYFGIVTGSKKTDNPLVLSASFNYVNADIISRYIYARAYAKN